jgi:hypothetical protein
MVNTFMSRCVGSNLLKGCCQDLITIDNVRKVHQDKGWQNQKGGHHLKGDLQIHQVNISWMCHKNSQMLMAPKITKQIVKENKLVPSSDQNTSTTIGNIGETTF